MRSVGIHTLNSIQTNQLVDDLVINGFLCWICCTSSPTNQYISTHLSKVLADNARESKDHLQRSINQYTLMWSNRPEYNVPCWDFAEGLFFIPIHDRGGVGHWMLAILDVATLTLEFYDSMSSQAQYDYWIPILKQWLSTSTPAIFRQRVKSKQITTIFATKDKVHQTMGLDCGVFVLYYALHRARRYTYQEVVNSKECTVQFMRETMRPFVAKILLPYLINL